ncbi:MAG: 1-acyl-sn-glycerol-3-phosphate acyltransferase [Bacteroidales bacterium]
MDAQNTDNKPVVEEINVREVFRGKNPRLARLLPGFVYRYIERIIHQRELNEILPQISHLYGLDFVRAGLDLLGIDAVAYGKENIPDEGRFIFVANHPLGGPDGLVFAKEVGDIFPKVKFIVNDILLNMKNLDPIFLPVNKHGKQSADYVRKIEDAYKSDAQMLNFPAGLCSRKVGGKIVDLEWQKNFVTKAKIHKRDVIPVHISGRNSNFFYNLARLRSFLGIKANIEMFYLPNEMFKQREKQIVMTFGKPISYKVFDRKRKPKEWAQLLKEHVYRLGREGSQVEFKK